MRTTPRAFRLGTALTGGLAALAGQAELASPWWSEVGIHLDFIRDVHAVQPSNGPAQLGTIDTLFTMTRGSQSTFQGSDGTVQYTNENMFQQSQTLDDVYWTKQQSSVSANAAVAPDGTTTADKIVEDGTTNFHTLLKGIALTGKTMTLSGHFKAAGRTWMALQLGGGSVFFNLSTGAVGTAAAGLTGTITSYGNGWYRCAVTGVATNTNALVLLASADTVSSYAGDGSSGVYAWGLQLQHGPTAGTYIATVGAANQNQFRYGWTVNGKKRGLQIEQASTNLIFYSQDLTDAAWTKSNATVTSNNAIAPDGTLTADTLVEDATAATTHRVVQTPAVAANNTATYSIFAKRGTGTRHLCIQQVGTGGTDYFTAYFDLGTGTFASSSVNGTASVVGAGVDVYANGWYRCWITAKVSTTVALSSGRWSISSGTTGGTESYNGDGVSSLVLWGAQVETNVKTSYNPTGALTQTRNADQVSRTDAEGILSNTAGTIVADVEIDHPALVEAYVLCKDDLGNDSPLSLQTGSPFVVRIQDGTTSTSKVTASPAIATGRIRMAAGFSGSEKAVTYHGKAVTAGAYDGSMYNGTTIRIGRRLVNADMLDGYIRELHYWPSRKPDDFLQAASLQTAA